MLDTIYEQNLKVIQLCGKVEFYLRKQLIGRALWYQRNAIEEISILMDELQKLKETDPKMWEMEEQELLVILQNIVSAQEANDYILMGDYYEMSLLPLLLNMQASMGMMRADRKEKSFFEQNLSLLQKKNPTLAQALIGMVKNETLSDSYVLESTSCGLPTLGKQTDGVMQYFHSNYRVMDEAMRLADEWYDPDCYEYNIFGFGLGYVIDELYERNSQLSVRVYEPDAMVIIRAMQARDLSALLLRDHFFLYLDEKGTYAKRYMYTQKEHTSFHVHYPTLRCMPQSAFKSELDQYMAYTMSIKNQIGEMNINFEKNMVQMERYLKNTRPVRLSVDTMKETLKNRKVFLVAAGPSLDQSMELLKQRKENTVIVAVGTVYKKLLQAGIRPDYVIISDGTERVYEQIQGLEHETIPLLLLSTAYGKIAENYEGPCYFIFQKGYQKARAYAMAQGYSLYETGGSVITVAIDLLLCSKIRTLVCIGLDLGFTHGKSHCGNTFNQTTLDSAKEVVQSNDGKMIGTTRNLTMYRQWIEQRIQAVSDVELINTTEGGAVIRGMKVKPLREVL